MKVLISCVPSGANLGRPTLLFPTPGFGGTATTCNTHMQRKDGSLQMLLLLGFCRTASRIPSYCTYQFCKARSLSPLYGTVRAGASGGTSVEQWPARITVQPSIHRLEPRVPCLHRSLAYSRTKDRSRCARCRELIVFILGAHRELAGDCEKKLEGDS